MGIEEQEQKGVKVPMSAPIKFPIMPLKGFKIVFVRSGEK
jgi:hypothetical protein